MLPFFFFLPPSLGKNEHFVYRSRICIKAAVQYEYEHCLRKNRPRAASSGRRVLRSYRDFLEVEQTV